MEAGTNFHQNQQFMKTGAQRAGTASGSWGASSAGDRLHHPVHRSVRHRPPAHPQHRVPPWQNRRNFQNTALGVGFIYIFLLLIKRFSADRGTEKEKVIS